MTSPSAAKMTSLREKVAAELCRQQRLGHHVHGALGRSTCPDGLAAADTAIEMTRRHASSGEELVGSKKPQLTVVPGEVIVDKTHLVTAHDDIHVFEVDLDTKYAEVLSVAQDDESTSVMLFKGEYGTHLDESHRGKPTHLVVEGLNHEWTVVTEITSRTARVVLYRSSNDKETER